MSEPASTVIGETTVVYLPNNDGCGGHLEIKNNGENYHSPVEYVLRSDLVSEPGLQQFLLRHQVKLRMLCCTECHVLLTAQTGLGHVRSAHLAPYARAPEAEYNQICQELGIRDNYPLDEELDGLDAVSGLDIYTMALVCGVKGCSGIFTTGGSMRKHYERAHRIKGAQVPTKWRVVSAQRIDNNNHKGFFAVKDLPRQPTPSLNKDWIDDLDFDIEGVMKVVTLDSADSRGVSAFLKKTRWPEHVQGLDGDELRALVCLPEEDEFPMLRGVVGWIIEVAMSVIDLTPSVILQKLETKDMARGISHDVFCRLQTTSGQRSYIEWLTRLVAFLLRDKGNYYLPLPVAVVDLITELKELQPPSELPPPLMSYAWNEYTLKIVELLMLIWTRAWDPCVGNILGDPTMCFVALASIKPDHGWAHAVEVTPIIARLVYCMRSVFLFYLYVDEPEAKVVRERHKELEKWHYEGEDSTFNSLCSLQHLASSVALRTASLPAFIWYDEDKTEFVWKGSLITLSMFRNLGHELMRSVYDLFINKVCFGMKWNIAGYIADDLTNSSPGYGFVSDSRNSKLYNRRAFMDRIMDEPGLRKEFLTGISPDGAPLLNLGRLRKWLSDYSNALSHLMAAIEVLAGSPSRGTELTCIQLRNTACRMRGVYTIGRRMAVVAQYSKTSAMTGRDTLIPHVLDAFCQEIVKIIAFRSHPFAEQVTRILFPGRNEMLNLWRTYLFVKTDRLFTTEDISAGLRVASLKTMEIQIGIRDYRQLSVCVRRAHCPTLEELVGLHEEDDPAALQAGHTKETENRIYGVSAGYLGQLPENLVEPYANASAEWQVLMQVPEGGKEVDLMEFEDKVLWDRHLSPDKSPYLRRRAFGQEAPSGSRGEAKPLTGMVQPSPEVYVHVSLPSIPTRVDSVSTVMTASEGIVPSSNVASLPFASGNVAWPDIVTQPTSSQHRNGKGAELNTVSTIADKPVSGTNSTTTEDRDNPNPADYDEWTNWQDASDITSHVSSDADLWEQLDGGIDNNLLREIASGVSQQGSATSKTEDMITIALENSALEAMKKLLRVPTCNWMSPEQRKATILAIQGRTDLIVALPTGSGKSMIPMLAAVLVKKTFIVVVPLVSLLEDWERRLKNAGMRCHVFQNGCPSFSDAPIVLATTDVAVMPDFSEAIGRAHAHGTLGGIIIDEVHDVLVSADFRKCMKSMWTLRTLPFPVVSMSGTLPVEMEKALISELSLSPKTVVVRKSSNRPELSYNIECSVRNPVELVKQIREILSSHNLEPTERTLIFVTTISDGSRLAQCLDCEFYTADNQFYGLQTKDKKDKAKNTYNRNAMEIRKNIVERWRQGTDPKHRILVCTTAFSTGNDYPHVRVVILATTPFDMSSAIQEMGRAGRDGKSAFCYIIPSKNVLPTSGNGFFDLSGKVAMHNMVWASSDCIRLSLTKYVDGENGISCAMDPRNMVCSRCRTHNLSVPAVTPRQWPVSKLRLHNRLQFHHPSPSLGNVLVPPSSSILDFPTPPAKRVKLHDAPFAEQARLIKKRKANAELDTEEYVARLKRALSTIDGLCTSCMVQNLDFTALNDHSANRCPNLDFRQWLAWKKNIRYTPSIHGPVCSCCHIPQIDDTLHKWITPGKSAISECPYPDRTLFLLFAVYQHVASRRAAETFFHTHWPDDVYYAKWLCAKPVAIGKTNSMLMFLWFIEHRWFQEE